MTPWWVAVLIMLTSVLVSAVINFHIKFSPDADTARRKLFLLATRAVMWASMAFVVYSLIKDALSTEPVTRATVVRIALLVGTLVFTVSMMMLSYALHALRDVLDSFQRTSGKTTNLLESMAGVLRKHSEIIAKQAPVSAENLAIQDKTKEN